MSGINNSINNSSITLAVGPNPVTPTTTYPLTMGYNQNAPTVALISSNYDAGTSSTAELYLESDVASVEITVGSAANSVARWAGRAEYGDATTGNGVNLTTATPSGDIRFYVKADTQAASIDTNSNFNCNNIVASTSNTHTLASLADTAAASTTAGPIVDLYRNSTQSATDLIGVQTYTANNSTPAKKTFAQHGVTVDVATASSESASWRLSTQSAGTLTNQIVALNTGCQIRGNNTNTAAPAGFIGQVLNSTVAPTAANIANSTPTQITSLALTAGNWLVFGAISVEPTTNLTYSVVGVNVASVTFTTLAVDYTQQGGLTGLNIPFVQQAPPQFLSLSTTTTYYLNAYVTFSAGTCAAGGTLQAVRIG